MAQNIKKFETISNNLTKCGEISASMLGNGNEFYLNCEFCDCSYLQLSNFIQHIYDDHLAQLPGRQFKQETATTSLYPQESVDCYDLENAAEEHLEDDLEHVGAQKESSGTNIASNNFETILFEPNEVEIKEELEESIKSEEDMPEQSISICLEPDEVEIHKTTDVTIDDEMLSSLQEIPQRKSPSLAKKGQDFPTPNDAEFSEDDDEANMEDNMEDASSSKESDYKGERTLNIELIKLYQTLPALWSVKHKHNRDPVIRTKQFNILLDKFKEMYPEAKLEDVKKRISNLRSNYCREKRILQTSRTEPKLYYYNEIRFLDQNKSDSKSKGDKSEHFEPNEAKIHNVIDVTTDDEMLSSSQRNLKRKKISTTKKISRAKKTQKLNHVKTRDVDETSKTVAAIDKKQDDSRPSYRYIKANDSAIDVSQRIILAEIYKKHTCLWDDTDIDYRFNNRRNDALKSVREEFNTKTELNLTENAFMREIMCLRKNCSNEKKRKLTCKQRNIEYKTSCTYWKYIEYLEVDVAPYVCSKCGEQCRGPTKLKVHEATHDGSEPFKCNFCGRGFHLVHYLADHLRRHVKDRRYRCEVCNKEFVTSSEVALHMRKHTGERPFVCYICGSTYISSSALLEHIMRHKKDKRFKCDICSKAFYSSSRLKSHKNTHSKVCKYICEICQKGFKERKHLSQHALIHSSVKRYICKICGKRFAQYAGLSCHMKSHGTTLALSTIADNKLE